MSLRRCLTLFLISLLALTPSAGALAAPDGRTAPAGSGPQAPAFALGTAFTYQGVLNNGGPVNGLCDFEFGLWNALGGGSQIGATLGFPNQTVTNGQFTVALDFGAGAFNGDARWLAIAVACPSGGSFVPLTPRQPLTPAPYALALPGLRTEQNNTSTNVIGGYSGNAVTSGMFGATIGGGGVAAFPNSVNQNYGTVGGGAGNTAGIVATVGGGDQNAASGDDATVAGGHSNAASGDNATVAGGANNTASDLGATVAGGFSNTASGAGATVGGGGWDGLSFSGNLAAGAAGTIGGGLSNQVTSGAPYGTVSGGITNTASGVNAVVAGGKQNTASGPGGTVGGGFANTASGVNATVPGGQSNTASGYASFAAGIGAQAIHDGAFVWADDSGGNLISKQPNQFLVRANGGVTLTTALGVAAVLPAGSGSWGVLSDRNAKANFDAVDGRQVLDALARIPIQTWNYKTQAADIRHMGPMAQDFQAAFGLGENDTSISTVDGQGVALAAIQGLYTVVQQKDAQISALQAQQAQTDARLAALESKAAPVAPPASAASLPLGWLLFAALALLNAGGLAGYWLARTAVWRNPKGL